MVESAASRCVFDRNAAHTGRITNEKRTIQCDRLWNI